MRFTYHSRVERNFNVGSYVRPLIEHLSQKGMKFIAISQLLHDDIEHFFPCAQIVDIPNGVDLEHIRAQKEKRKIYVRCYPFLKILSLLDKWGDSTK